MTDTIALREKIKESGYKLVFIANKIQGLCDLLRIDTGEKEAIFFCTECR